MKRTLKIEVSATNVFDAEENAIYGGYTPERRAAHTEEMRAEIARWFADNMEEGASITVNVSVEEAANDGSTQESGE
ncbi:hypothetical protein C162_26735 [Paenibacillus sp. FSL R7-269]|uniref:hypothetical protein n=1 Tax=Paenibacillus sp. FSL R7-269 TaxID=1226755 RepID=UPI0003E28A63|nr:hypothetical protein [Paenibacillus sp. FSL R7-269]ETT40923.1 hypothetical protein C162_26735 [Paenibacillus sp. FSL R7-269]